MNQDRRNFLACISGFFAAVGLAGTTKALGHKDAAISVPLSELPKSQFIKGKAYEVEFDRIPIKPAEPIVNLCNGTFCYAQATTLTWGKHGHRIGLLVQNLEVITPVAGRKQGVFRTYRLMGPSSLVEEFLEQFGNVMNARDNTLILEPLGYPRMSYTLHNFVLTSIGMAVKAGKGAGGMTIIEKVEGMFLNQTQNLKPYTEQMVEYLDQGLISSETALKTSFSAEEQKEEFCRKILPPLTITNDQLDRVIMPEVWTW